MGATILLVTALIIYTLAVKTDFQTFHAIIIVVLLAFILFGISFAFTMSSVLHTLYCTFGVIVAGIIFIVDLQMIADGERGCSLDNPVLGALILYLDIMRIFLYILMAMGKKK
jgi:FtsH-binding integral membrane protein